MEAGEIHLEQIRLGAVKLCPTCNLRLWVARFDGYGALECRVCARLRVERARQPRGALVVTA